MSRKKRTVSIHRNSVSDADIQKYRKDDTPVKLVIGGFRVNHRPVSAREFKRALHLPLILLGACLLGLVLYSFLTA